LLDTNVFYRLLVSPGLVPEAIKAQIASPGNGVFISVAAPIEMVIKANLDRLELPPDWDDFARGFENQAKLLGANLLPITLDHAARLRDLPLHHRDPFDRLMIAQALAEGMTLVSSDRQFARYDTLDLIAV